MKEVRGPSNSLQQTSAFGPSKQGGGRDLGNSRLTSNQHSSSLQRLFKCPVNNSMLPMRPMNQTQQENPAHSHPLEQFSASSQLPVTTAKQGSKTSKVSRTNRMAKHANQLGLLPVAQQSGHPHSLAYAAPTVLSFPSQLEKLPH